MSRNLGKQFEDKFKQDWNRTFPSSILIRLPDQQSKYYGSSRNPCDFILYVNWNFWMIECKTHKGNTFPWTKFPQYDLLKDIPFNDSLGSHGGVVLWMYEYDNAIFYLPIQTIKQMKKDGLKSFNVRLHDFEKYPAIKIPSVKKRVFYDSDYSILMEEVCQKPKNSYLT